MQVVTPDLVADLCGLSLGVLLTAGVVGVVLWLFGWRCHRFWVVLFTTVAAGVYGLQEAALFKASPLVTALLLAIAAGVLALALVRLLAFGAGGLVGLIIVHAAAPSVDQPLVVFILSGLVSLLLFRWFLMALTSFAGAAVLSCTGLALLNMYGSVDAVVWTGQSGAMLNWICGLMAVMGFLFQFLLDRRSSRQRADEEHDDSEGMLFRFTRFYRRAG